MLHYYVNDKTLLVDFIQKGGKVLNGTDTLTESSAASDSRTTGLD